MTIYARRSLAAIAARWDAKADVWDEQLLDADCHLNEDEAYERFLQVARDQVCQRRDFCARTGVIDAGCGTGLVLRQVMGSFDWGIGVDISAKMVRAARRKRMKNARFVVGDCFQLPELVPPAGAILSRGVLLSHYGLKHGRALLRAARQALAPGGFLLFDFLNAQGQASSAHAAKHKRWFQAGEVRAMARDAGLARIRVLGARHLRVRILLAHAPA